MAEFSWPLRVYYEDTDSGGVVYYANYLRFMERARTEWLRSLGLEQDTLREHEGILFAVHSLQMNYHKPAHFNDRLRVTVQVEKIGRASVDFLQQVCKERDRRAAEAQAATDEIRELEILCSGRVRVACVSACSIQARAMPVHVRNVLKAAEGRCGG